MTLQEYMDARAGRKVGKDIEERWQGRVVAQGMRGAAGAARYLQAYGKSIGPEKVVALAIRAGQAFDYDMAVAFWKVAYKLETGADPEPEVKPVQPTAKPVKVVLQTRQEPVGYPGLPAKFTPGMVVTMQPTDGLCPRALYIADTSYAGQPKKDGNRMVVFGTPSGAVAYQSRSLAVKGPQDTAIHAALSKHAIHQGGFVLDGEWWWEDAAGGEHRTGAQAITTNIELGQPTVPPVARYSIFAALWTAGSGDLTRGPAAIRLNVGRAHADQLHLLCPGILPVETAYASHDKAELVKRQEAEGREGEVWYRLDAPYDGGKHPGEAIVRTKYTVEFDAIVLGLPLSDKKDRAFTGIEIGLWDPETKGVRPIGTVGTGFTRPEARALVKAHAAYKLVTGGYLTVKVQTRRFTEGGNVWHASYEGLSEKQPWDCTVDQIKKEASHE